MVPTQLDELASLGLQAFELQAAGGDQMLPVVAPAEHLRELVVQGLDAFLVMGVNLPEDVGAPRALLSHFFELGQCSVSQLKSHIALSLFLVALFHTELPDEEWLFLRADTLLPPGRAEVVHQTLRVPGVAAGAFHFRIAGSFAGKSFVEWVTGFRSRWLQRPYGDQGLFLTKALFEEMGGFADLPIMEDYEFSARLRRRGRILTVGEPALTSARRWQTLGVVRTTLRNQWMLVGYHLGVSPQKLATRYRALGR